LRGKLQNFNGQSGNTLVAHLSGPGKASKAYSPGGKGSSISILNVSPVVDCGRYPAKRIQGETLSVSSDIVKPGHELVAGNLVWRMHDKPWNSQPMVYTYNEDRWSSVVILEELGSLEFFVEAWTDKFSKILQDLNRWLSFGEDVNSEIVELTNLIKIAAQNAPPIEHEKLEEILKTTLAPVSRSISAEEPKRLFASLSNPEISSLVIKNLEKTDYASTPVYAVIVDRRESVYSTWYEMFHRSQGTVEGRSATFLDCVSRLPEIKAMGFDIIYLPPVHPIGKTNRRGPNNTRSESANDPGSPWAIGNELGGHDSINPDLGTIEDFARFVQTVKSLGMEVALDLAFQVSPDHPYVRAHPEWFYHRSYGTIKFAENPPKRYYDIYPLNFETSDRESLWNELRRVVEYWISNGVKIFRVDNPHTKPVPFWEWLISVVREAHPEAIFLSEAFTRPKAMKLLSKIGFDQSYTYFTWKNAKWELTEFIKEFFLSDVSEYYRPNLFTNTPDILPEYLQSDGRAAFKIRATLAATLSSCYGIYNGFELCENRPRSKGSEEYLDSEKYQYKVWDWNRPGNIKDYITRLNSIRRENEALQVNSTLHLIETNNENIISFGKWTPNLSNVIIVVVNLDPHAVHDGTVSVPFTDLQLPQSYVAEDLITGQTFSWFRERNYVKLDPSYESAHILRLRKRR
jgi:starch synthase (maltosyl-transferring)